MRAHRAITFAAAFLALACTTEQSKQQTAVGAAPGKPLPAVTDAEVTRADLDRFGALPARMDIAGQPSTDAQVALGRSLYYETRAVRGARRVVQLLPSAECIRRGRPPAEFWPQGTAGQPQLAHGLQCGGPGGAVLGRARAHGRRAGQGPDPQSGRNGNVQQRRRSSRTSRHRPSIARLSPRRLPARPTRSPTTTSGARSARSSAAS